MPSTPTIEQVHGSTMATAEEDSRLNPFNIVTDDYNNDDNKDERS